MTESDAEVKDGSVAPYGSPRHRSFGTLGLGD